MRKKLRPILFVLFLQIMTGLFHLLLFNFGHPLNELTRHWPFVLKVFIISIYAALAYFVVGILSMVALNFNEKYLKNIEYGLIALMVIFGASFLAMSLHFSIYGRESTWVTYMVLNPLFGTAMYGRVPEGAWSLLWVTSVIVPSLFLYFGQRFALLRSDKN